MDSEITGTVLSATPRVVGNNRTIYDIAFSDGNTYTTFDAKIWAKVQQVGQQPATARVSVVQKPKDDGTFWTNFYLNDIAPQGQLAATSAPVATPPPPQAARAPSGGMSAEDKARVTWLSCLSSAAQGLVAGLDESEILRVARVFYGATAKGEYKTEQQAPLAPVEGPTPVAVGAAETPPNDAIPW